MIKNKSIHLQDFPDVAGFNSTKYNQNELVAQMDLVQEICSVALAIRDNKNLRVRLPLKSITIIGKNAKNLALYQDIIADEVNVKNVILQEDIGDIASLKLQINFKKIGIKFKEKIKQITIDAKNNNWQLISGDKIKIADEILTGDDYELKLSVKEHNQNEEVIMALSTNDCLVKLDITTSIELENEGLARDLIRSIQQNRKDANFDITTRIKINIFTDNNDKLKMIISDFGDYIRNQVLATEINVFNDKESFEKTSIGYNIFKNNIEKYYLDIAIS